MNKENNRHQKYNLSDSENIKELSRAYLETHPVTTTVMLSVYKLNQVVALLKTQRHQLKRFGDAYGHADINDLKDDGRAMMAVNKDADHKLRNEMNYLEESIGMAGVPRDIKGGDVK